MYNQIFVFFMGIETAAILACVPALHRLDPNPPIGFGIFLAFIWPTFYSLVMAKAAEGRRS